MRPLQVVVRRIHGKHQASLARLRLAKFGLIVKNPEHGVAQRAVSRIAD